MIRQQEEAQYALSMTHNLHPDDQPPSNWQRPTSDDEIRAALPEPSMQDPASLGFMFCSALGNRAEFADMLERFVTPESLPAWGDFSEAAEFLDSIEDLGYGTVADRAVGDDDVAYFKLLSGITGSYQAMEEQIVSSRGGVLTMVWRPEFGEWRVHGIGNYVRPEEVPH